MHRFALIAAAALAACSSQQQTEVTNQTKQLLHNSASTVDVMRKTARHFNAGDAGITIRVEAAIAGQAGSNVFHISPSVHDGVVTLKGTVPNTTVQKTVVDNVSRVSGVKRVVNQLRIAP